MSPPEMQRETILKNQFTSSQVFVKKGAQSSSKVVIAQTFSKETIQTPSNR